MSRLLAIFCIFSFLSLTSLPGSVSGLEIPQNDIVWDGNRAAPFQNHQQIRDNMVFDGVNLTIRAGTFVYHNQSLTRENEEFEGDPRGPFYLLFINGASLIIEGTEDQQVVFGRPQEGWDNPRSCSIYIHIESLDGMQEVSDVSITNTQFWNGASFSRANPNEDRQLIENYLDFEWNPEETVEYFSNNTVDQNIFIDINRHQSQTPLIEDCYFHLYKLILRGEGNGDQNRPDLLNNEFYSHQGGFAEYSPEYYSIALGSSHPSAPQPAEGFIITGCEFYNSFDSESCNQMLQISTEYVEGNPNIIRNCYFHHAHESLVHVYSGHNIFLNCDFEHTSDACLKQVFRGRNNEIRALMEVYNCRFRYYGDHAVYHDADGRDNFQLVMKNCIVTENNGIGFMNNEEQVFASRDGSITVRGDALIENCSIYHNRQYGRREGMDVDRTAGIYIANSEYEFDVTIRNCIIYDNDIGVTYEVEPQAENSFKFCNLNGNFIPTENWEGWEAEEFHNIAENPQFVDAENSDLHLLFDSPCINAGFSISTLDPDGSPVDLGIFGGSKADDFRTVRMTRFMHEQRGENINDHVYFENMNDYCLIGINDVELDVDAETEILHDTYKLTSNLIITPNDRLTIQQGTEIRAAHETGIWIEGSVEFGGSPVSPIKLTSSDQQNWDGINFIGTADQSRIHHCQISNAFSGINVSNLSNFAGSVQISNVVINNCTFSGIKIYNSRVAVGIDDAQNSKNLIKNCGEYGIIITSSDPDDVRISSTEITQCGTGLYLYAANPIVENCKIFENRNAGISAHNVSLPNLSPAEQRANRIIDNSNHEIMLFSGSNPTINNNNIIDLEGIIPDGLSIWTDFDELLVDATGNYYGLPADMVNEDWFSGDNILWNPPADGILPGIDDINPDRRELICKLWKTGKFGEVVQVCNQVLTNQRSTENELLAAVTYSRSAYKAAGFRIGELRDVLLYASEMFAGIRNSHVFKYHASRCLIDQRQFNEAKQEYEDALLEVKNTGNNRLSVFSEIDLIEFLIACGLITNKNKRSEYYNRLFELYKELFKDEGINQYSFPESIFPQSLHLISAYPNPFNSSTRINYYIPKQTPVRIKIHDSSGREVSNIFDCEQTVGLQTITWTPEKLAGGVYYCRLESELGLKTLKLVLVR